MVTRMVTSSVEVAVIIQARADRGLDMVVTVKGTGKDQSLVVAEPIGFLSDRLSGVSKREKQGF